MVLHNEWIRKSVCRDADA